jgi:hypothetical protein
LERSDDEVETDGEQDMPVKRPRHELSWLIDGENVDLSGDLHEVILDDDEGRKIRIVVTADDGTHCQPTEAGASYIDNYAEDFASKNE